MKIGLLFISCCVMLLVAPAAGQTGSPASSYGTFAFDDTVRFAGTPEAVYDGITGDITGWWDHSFSQKPYRMYIEPKPGGGFYEIFSPLGDGVLHATVTGAHRGIMLRFVGPLGLAGRAVDMVTTWTFAAAGSDSTDLILSVHAAGELKEGLDIVVRGVWHHFLVERFAPYWNTKRQHPTTK
jgi:hypothetical protein